MKFIILFLFGILPGIGTLAQSSGYLYIESSPSQPFYLRTRDSIYNSSPGNYLILAPLDKVKGEIVVGLSGMANPALIFTIDDPAHEYGLILKDLGAEGWRLLNWQTNLMIGARRPHRDDAERLALNKRTDDFAVRLAQLVNDEAILYYRPTLDARFAGDTSIIKSSLSLAEQETARDSVQVDESDARVTDTTQQPVAIQPQEMNKDSIPGASSNMGGIDTARVESEVKLAKDSVESKTPVDEKAILSETKADTSGNKIPADLGKATQSPTTVRRLEKMKTREGWQVIYEVTEKGKKERVIIEIPGDND